MLIALWRGSVGEVDLSTLLRPRTCRLLLFLIMIRSTPGTNYCRDRLCRRRSKPFAVNHVDISPAPSPADTCYAPSTSPQPAATADTDTPRSSVQRAVKLSSAQCSKPFTGPPVLRPEPRGPAHVVRIIAHWSRTQCAATHPFVPGHRPISVLPLFQRCAAGIADLDNIARICELVVPLGVFRAQI